MFSKVISGLESAYSRVVAGLVGLDLNPSPVAPPGVEEKVKTVLDWLFWIGTISVFVGFVVGGIMLIISNERGMGNENVRRIGFVIIGAIVIASASALAKALV
ncbi:MAG: hypothetical protein Q4D87_05755 [Actinomycetaceae bacterium]|nr:hypothetical protein [Actinomycetaceae bacterium]